MQSLAFYLKKFEKFGFEENLIKSVTTEVVKERTGIEVLREEVELRNSQVRIKKDGPEKAEIFLYREKIEKEVNKKLENELGRKSDKIVR